MTSPKLELRGLRKEYDGGEVVAVENLNLSLMPGETLAILGPSGCGKSTTLNMVVGIEQPTAGDILIDGVSVLDQPPGTRNVGLVFQDYAVFTHMSVEQNLAFGLKVRGLPRREISQAVGETAELLDLQHMLKTPAAQLGGSELQRVAIGRTLVTRPALLLLDEPLSNLETEMRGAMRRELRKLSQEIGQTIVYVTHDQTEALSLAQQIAVMSNGKLRQCAPADQVSEQPAHTFVAGFIGEPAMNLMRGTLTPTPEGGRFVADGVEINVGEMPAQAPSGIVLGFRANAVSLTSRDDSPLQGQVKRLEPRGRDTLVEVDLAGHLLKTVIPSRACPEPETEVGLTLDPDRLVFFDDDTQTNLMERAG